MLLGCGVYRQAPTAQPRHSSDNGEIAARIHKGGETRREDNSAKYAAADAVWRCACDNVRLHEFATADLLSDRED